MASRELSRSESDRMNEVLYRRTIGSLEKGNMSSVLVTEESNGYAVWLQFFETGKTLEPALKQFHQQAEAALEQAVSIYLEWKRGSRDD